jgi:hypothetical protein
VSGFQSLDAHGQFGNGQRCRVDRCLRQPGLELVTKRCQLRQVTVMGEGPASADFVITDLALGYRQVLSRRLALSLLSR